MTNTIAPKAIPAGQFIESLRTQNPASPQLPKTEGLPFSHVLDEQVSGLKFSAHAQTRLESRGIELTSEDRVRLQEAVDRAREKGSRESLVLMDNAAFVVSVKNNTVITAVDKASLKENVFTNIDSTILV